MSEKPRLRVISAEPCSFCPQRDRGERIGDEEFCMMAVLEDDIPGWGYIANLRVDLIEAGFNVGKTARGGKWGDNIGREWSINVPCPCEAEKLPLGDRVAGITVIQSWE